MDPPLATSLAVKTAVACCRSLGGSASNSGGALPPSPPKRRVGNSRDPTDSSTRNFTSDMDAENGRELLQDRRPQPFLRFRRRLAVFEREVLGRGQPRLF